MKTTVVLIDGTTFDDVSGFSYVPSTMTYNFVGRMRDSNTSHLLSLSGPWSSILYVIRDGN